MNVPSRGLDLETIRSTSGNVHAINRPRELPHQKLWYFLDLHPIDCSAIAAQGHFYDISGN